MFLVAHRRCSRTACLWIVNNEVNIFDLDTDVGTGELGR